MKRTHAGSRRADHVCERLLADFARIGSGFAFLAKIRKQQKGSRQAFLARIEQLIDPESSSTRLLRAKRCEMNNSAKAGSLWITRIISAFGIRVIAHSVRADTDPNAASCPAKHLSPKKFAGAQNGGPRLPCPARKRRFFLAFACLNVKNRIRRFALPINNLVFPVFRNGFRPRSLSRETL